MTTVVMDTNALMMPVELDVRVFEELERVLGTAPEVLELLAPRPVVEELSRLSEGAGAEAVAASVGADLVDRCRVVGTDASFADDAVLELAEREDAYVVTNDKPLRDRLLERGIRVIGLRGRDKLDVTEP